MQKLYGFALLIVFVPVVLLVNFYAWSGLQPFTIELTRVGGFPEEGFGWFGTEYKFAESPVESFHEGGVYENYADMVVFGDSFSMEPDSNWLYHFVNATGLSAQAMYYYQGGIERLVDTDLYKARPPRVVVFQVVERLFKDTFQTSPVDCKLSDAVVPLPADFERLDLPLTAYKRDMSPRYGNYKQAMRVVRNRLYLLAGYGENLKSRITPLTNDTLFSNKNSENLLYLADDQKKMKWPEDVSLKVRCGLEGIKERVEANGYTAFAVMLVPDKLSTYSPWIIDDKLAGLTLLDNDALTTIPHSLDIRAMAIEEIEQGFVDFYLPGGTHWSSKGDRMVAQWMVDMFQADTAHQ